MPRDVVPTDPEAERTQGRVAVWLDPEDVLWLLHYLTGYSADAAEFERVGRLRFRLQAALHKAGLPNDPWAGNE